AEHAGQRRGLGARAAAAEARRQDAGARAHRRAGERRGRVPDRAEVMAIQHALRPHELAHADQATGVWSWITTVDHKRIGILYGVTAFAFFLIGGLLLNASFLVGTPPNAGWFGYANLTTRQFSPGPAIDFWMLSLQVLGASSIMAGVNFIVTILNMRAPGMTLMRMPLFVWM